MAGNIGPACYPRASVALPSPPLAAGLPAIPAISNSPRLSDGSRGGLRIGMGPVMGPNVSSAISGRILRV